MPRDDYKETSKLDPIDLEISHEVITLYNHYYFALDLKSEGGHPKENLPIAAAILVRAHMTRWS